MRENCPKASTFFLDTHFFIWYNGYKIDGFCHEVASALTAPLGGAATERTVGL